MSTIPSDENKTSSSSAMSTSKIATNTRPSSKSLKRRLDDQSQLEERIVPTNRGGAVDAMLASSPSNAVKKSTMESSSGGCLPGVPLLCGAKSNPEEAEDIASKNRSILSTSSNPGGLFGVNTANTAQRQQQRTRGADGNNTTDPLLAAELASLSVKDRERLYEEIHGCLKQEDLQHPKDGDQEFVKQKLQEMDEELSKMRNRAAYNLAHFLAPSRVKDPKFRLQFLRAEHFDPNKAARRLKLHYEYKATLFGMDKVADAITWDDLTDDDKDAVRSGSIQVLPEPDTAGRTVIFVSPKHVKFKSWKNMLRSFWYQLMAVSEHREALNTGGMVSVFYYTGMRMDQRHPEASQIYRNAYLIRDGLPVRIASSHFCLNDPALHAILKLSCAVGGKEFRLRFRYHFGSHVECHYALTSFGIPRHVLPVNVRGIFNTKGIEKFVEKQMEKEDLRRKQEGVHEETSNKPTLEGTDAPSTPEHAANSSPNDEGKLVAVATDEDVLFGRGKPYQVHKGNIRLAEMIEERQDIYHSTNKKGKTQLSQDIVELIESQGGRFLKKNDKNPDMWEVVTSILKRDKVAHGFRTTPNRGGSKKSGNNNDSMTTTKIETIQPRPQEQQQQQQQLAAFNSVEQQRPQRGMGDNYSSDNNPSIPNNSSGIDSMFQLWTTPQQQPPQGGEEDERHGNKRTKRMEL